MRKKTRGRLIAKRLGLAGVLFAVLAGSIASVWGVLALYRYIVGDWNRREAFLRLDYIFGEKHVSAKKVAQELPYIFAYQQQYPIRFPKYAEIEESLFLDVIPKIPKEADPMPLLEFPSDSPAYSPIFELLKQNTDLAWQMQRSCDAMETARHFGGDLLMASLPFISWSEADKKLLRERTEIDEKQRRFRKYAEQSQAAAEKKLPGRYYFQLESMCSGLTKDKGGIVPDAKERKAQPPGPVIEVTCKNKSWNVSFFKRTWTGSIEQITRIDLMCPVKEHHDIFGNLPFYQQLQEAEMHLRFKGDKFVVELEGLPLMEYMTEHQSRMMDLMGFSGFKSTVIKAGQ